MTQPTDRMRGFLEVAYRETIPVAGLSNECVRDWVNSCIAGITAQFQRYTLLRALELASEAAEADTLRRVQREQVPWVLHNFGERESWQPLLGAQEELGELAHAHLKGHQGIRSGEDHEANAKDAVADVIIFLCDYSSSRGWDIAELLGSTWDEVKKRDWKKDPDTAHEAMLVDAAKGGCADYVHDPDAEWGN